MPLATSLGQGKDGTDKLNEAKLKFSNAEDVTEDIVALKIILEANLQHSCI